MIFDREKVQTRMQLRRTLQELDGRSRLRRAKFEFFFYLAIALPIIGTAIAFWLRWKS
jgi:hypothetical protein